MVLLDRKWAMDAKCDEHHAWRHGVLRHGGEIVKLLLKLIALGLVGCANPYAAFDQTSGLDITQSDRIVCSDAPPKVFRGNDPEADRKALLQNGYALIGHSRFNAASAFESQLVTHAQKVHAKMVVTYSAYTNFVSGIDGVQEER